MNEGTRGTDVERQWGGRLMYTPHPEANRLWGLMPPSLADAVLHTHTVQSRDVMAMRGVAANLALETLKFRPALIPFFATGGIPIAISLMHRLADGGDRAFTDGSHFHLFPGLAWDGMLDGRRPAEFFVETFVVLLRHRLRNAGRVRVLTFDTTNTGNAVNKIVDVFAHACQKLHPDEAARVELRVVGIVNGERAAERRSGASDRPVATAAGDIYLLMPSGCEPTSPLRDQVAVTFRRDKGDRSFSLSIAYWIIDRIPTEDEAALIGAHALHQHLRIAPDNTAGHMMIVFDNGQTADSTGLDALGRRFLHLLSAKDASFAWRKLCDANAQFPVGEDEREDYEQARHQTRGGLRLFDYMHSDPRHVIQRLLARPHLDGVDVYWLSMQTDLPQGILRKVVASARRDPEDVGPEALTFFRKVRPNVAEEEPRGADAATIEWWLNRLEAEGNL